MAPRAGFVTGGCWCFDRNKTIPFWPGEDQSVSVQSVLTRGGGSACNFAIAMRRLDPAIPIEDHRPGRQRRRGPLPDRGMRSPPHRPQPAARHRCRAHPPHRCVLLGAFRTADAFLRSRHQRPAGSGAFRLHRDDRPVPASRPAGHPSADGRAQRRRREWLGQRAARRPRGRPAHQPRTGDHRCGPARVAGAALPVAARYAGGERLRDRRAGRHRHRRGRS